MVRALYDARAVQNCSFRAPISLFRCPNVTPINLENSLNNQILKYLVINDHALPPICETQKAGVFTWR